MITTMLKTTWIHNVRSRPRKKKGEESESIAIKSTGTVHAIAQIVFFFAAATSCAAARLANDAPVASAGIPISWWPGESASGECPGVETTGEETCSGIT